MFVVHNAGGAGPNYSKMEVRKTGEKLTVTVNENGTARVASIAMDLVSVMALRDQLDIWITSNPCPEPIKLFSGSIL